MSIVECRGGPITEKYLEKKSKGWLIDYILTSIKREQLRMAQPIKVADLENWFMYHPPTQGQQERYVRIREHAKEFAKVLLECTPAGPDQEAAIRKVREAVMTSNAAIACGG